MAVDAHVSPRLYDRPRSSPAMPPARGFRANRPGEVVATGQPAGTLLGSPGPNIGYALSLAQPFRDRLEVADHEHPDDAVAVGAEIAMRRAATLGRAPVGTDLECAFTLLGYLGGAPADLVEWRRPRTHGARREYDARRVVVDAVRPEALALGADDLRAALAEWRTLILPDATP